MRRKNLAAMQAAPRSPGGRPRGRAPMPNAEVAPRRLASTTFSATLERSERNADKRVDLHVDLQHVAPHPQKRRSTPLRVMPRTTQQTPVRGYPISPGNGRHRRRRPTWRDIIFTSTPPRKSAKKPKTSFLRRGSRLWGDSRDHFSKSVSFLILLII